MGTSRDEVASNNDYAAVILAHYRREALKYGADPKSTIDDETIREHEIAAILQLMDHVLARRPVERHSRVIDIGCGNGYLLAVLRSRYPELDLTGIEYSPEMLDVARRREVPGCSLVEGDVRRLAFDSALFDVAVTERCI